VKKALLIGIAALFLATGTAHANHMAYYQCGKDRIWVNIGRGFEEYKLLVGCDSDGIRKERPLSGRFFRWRGYNDVLYYRGRECDWIDSEDARLKCAFPS